MAPDEFVGRVQAELDAGRRSKALDLIFDTIEDLLLTQELGRAEACVRALLRSQPPLPCLLSLLTVTKPWRKELVAVRGDLVEAVRGIPLLELRETILAGMLEP